MTGRVSRKMKSSESSFVWEQNPPHRPHLDLLERFFVNAGGCDDLGDNVDLFNLTGRAGPFGLVDLVDFVELVALVDRVANETVFDI